MDEEPAEREEGASLMFALNPEGSRKTNPDYQEIFRLRAMLEADHIPFMMTNLYDGWKIGYPAVSWLGEEVCSVVEHGITYGHDADLLEIMGLTTDEEDEVRGWLTAEDVYLRIVSHYQNTQEASRVEKENQ